MFRHLPKLYNIDPNGSAKGTWIDGTLLRRFSLETLISTGRGCIIKQDAPYCPKGTVLPL